MDASSVAGARGVAIEYHGGGPLTSP
jgi:hypothetical protein